MSTIDIETPITPEKFGKDHWSTLAYAETCAVEGSCLDKRRLRCNPNRHPMHNVEAILFASQDRPEWDAKYGTRLAGFFENKDLKLRVGEHDDWDCLNDLEAAGLIEVISEANAYIVFTDLGLEVTAALRKHKANGGNFSNFRWSPKE